MAMQRLQVFELVEGNSTHLANVVNSKFVFTRKRDTHGRVIRHKARLVAQGFTQRKGIDFNETFAPAVNTTSLRMFMAFAVHRGMILKQADIFC